MSDASSLVRSLLIYGICLPLAIILGYVLATPLDMTSFVMLGILFGILIIPIFLQWHYAWLFLFWNTNMMAFFLPGKPSFAMLLCLVSFTISAFQHILNKRLKFIYVPTIAWPLFFLAAVVLITAYLRGGIHLNAAGSDTFGGKRYIDILVAIIGFFAMTARQIPLQKVALYVKLYFLGAVTLLAGNVAGLVSPSLYFIFVIFPVDPAALAAGSATGQTGGGAERFSGLGMAATSIISFMLAYYGIKGIFSFRKYWRLLFFIALCIAFLFGGFRSWLISFIITFAILFYMEGAHRTMLMPMFLLGAMLTVGFTLAFSDHLPLSIQRTMSFLPVKIDPMVADDAKASSEWRVEMWKSVLPTIPDYLLLGKGYSFSQYDMEMIRAGMTAGGDTIADAQAAMLAGDYHNGPLSVIVPLGIWGVVGFLWFLAAGIKVLRQNYRYGDPALERINRFLLVTFIARTIGFFLIFGSLYSELFDFVGVVGLSICINGGMRRGAAPAPAPKPVINKLKLARASASR